MANPQRLVDGLFYAVDHEKGGTPVPNNGRFGFMGAMANIQQGNLAGAETKLQMVRSLAEKSKDVETAALVLIGEGYFVLCASNNVKLAAEKYCAGFEAFAQVRGQNNPCLAPLANDIATLFKALGDDAKFEEWDKRAKDLAAKH